MVERLLNTVVEQYSRNVMIDKGAVDIDNTITITFTARYLLLTASLPKKAFSYLVSISRLINEITGNVWFLGTMHSILWS